jgi:hypothetical protein
MKPVLAVILLALISWSGCVHPPPPTQREISFDTLPPKVIARFNARFPGAEVKRVVEWFFNRRVVCYYIDCSQAGSPVRTVAITPKGEVTLAMINLWSAPWEPSVTYNILDDGFVCMKEYFRGKTSNIDFPITKEQSDALLAVTKAAHEELLNTRKISNIVDGVNIRISIDGDLNPQSAAILRNYAKRLYNLKQVPLLFDKLHEIIPEKYWRIR